MSCSVSYDNGATTSNINSMIVVVLIVMVRSHLALRSYLWSRSLWPSAQACEECWSEFLPGHNEPPWSETEVLNFLVATYSCPDAVGEGADSPGNRWAVTCVLVCAIVAVFMWARKWQEMRGVGLTKRLEDAAPSV